VVVNVDGGDVDGMVDGMVVVGGGCAGTSVRWSVVAVVGVCCVELVSLVLVVVWLGDGAGCRTVGAVDEDDTVMGWFCAGTDCGRLD
jgi:hypothetical protein